MAVGYTLDELTNDITGVTPASFEPSIDYVVTKVPRFTFEKFSQAENRLTTQMKSVGEVMAIGRTFKESFQKALRGLETGVMGLDSVLSSIEEDRVSTLTLEMRQAGAERIWFVADAFREGISIGEIAEASGIDKWFLSQIEDLVRAEKSLDGQDFRRLTETDVRLLKRDGFSDARLALLLGCSEEEFRQYRKSLGVFPVFAYVPRVLVRRFCKYLLQ